MPIYDFKCFNCNVLEERIVKTEEGPQNCPVCGNIMEKLLSAPAFHLKGSGWYKTDFDKKPEAPSSTDQTTTPTTTA